jgi:transposase-like protein
VSAACRHFGISREIYYRWKRAYEKDGEQALVNSKPCPENPKLRTNPEVEEKTLHLRQTYHFGGAANRLVPRALLRHHHLGRRGALRPHAPGSEPLPRNERKRSPVYQRYEKQVPGHHVQIDVKFLDFRQPDGQKARRFQYTAIDDATRIRALKIYEKHTQENDIRSTGAVKRHLDEMENLILEARNLFQ